MLLHAGQLENVWPRMNADQPIENKNLRTFYQRSSAFIGG